MTTSSLKKTKIIKVLIQSLWILPFSFFLPEISIYGSAVIVFVIAGWLYSYARLDIVSPIGILFGVYIIYFLPRGLLLIFDVHIPAFVFMLSIDTLRETPWLFFIAVFISFFMIGYIFAGGDESKLKSNSKKMRSESYVRLMHYMAIILGVIALSGFVMYLNRVGGIQGVINQYSHVDYADLMQDNALSMIKNITVYFIFASLICYLSNIYNPSRIDHIKTLLLFVAGLVILLAFTRRGNLLMLIIVMATYWHHRVSEIRPLQALFGGVFLGGLLYGLYVVRSVGIDSVTWTSMVELFDSAEFWVFDQYINVAANVNTLYSSEYAMKFINSFVFFLFPYDQYESIGQSLIFRSVGINGWGIPPTLLGSTLLIGGPFIAPFVALFLGAGLGTVKQFILRRINNNVFMFPVYLLYLMYTWYLFRNGDPMSAVYFTNRIFIVVGLTYLTATILEHGINITRRKTLY